MGLLLLSAACFVGSAVFQAAASQAAPAQAATTPTCPNPPGSPCQAFFYVDKTTGQVTKALPLPGGNVKGQEIEAVECQGAGPGECYLATSPAGFLLLHLNASDCSATSNTTQITPSGQAPSTYIEDLAWSPASSTLYAVSQDGQLFSVDTSNGSVAAVGPGGLNAGTVGGLSAITYDPVSGELYAAQDMGSSSYRLVRIATSTGQVDPSYGPVTIADDNAGGHNRTETLGLTYVGGTLYGAMADGGDAFPNLVTIDPTTGASTDIGPMGVDYVGALTSDSSGALYSIAGTRGANITPYPCPSSPSPSPSTSPSPSPSPSPSSPGPSPSPSPSPSTPAPSPSTTPPGPTPSPTTSVLGGGFVNSPSPSPTSSVLGLNITRRPGLPVTGVNLLPLVVLVGMCYLFGAVALRFSSSGKPHALGVAFATARARAARSFFASWFLDKDK